MEGFQHIAIDISKSTPIVAICKYNDSQIIFENCNNFYSMTNRLQLVTHCQLEAVRKSRVLLTDAYRTLKIWV